MKHGDDFCPNCGANLGSNSASSPLPSPVQSQPYQQQQPYQQPGQQQNYQYGTTTQTTYVQPGAQGSIQKNKAADQSLLFAIIGLFVLPFLGGLLAVIFGIQGLSNPYNRHKAIIGLILGIIEMGGYALFAIIRFF